MNLYINIHTHYTNQLNGISIINNRFGFDNTIHSKTPFSIGFHPWDTDLVTKELITKFETYITHANCFAIGECGIDKHITMNIEKQITVFNLQLQLALNYNKPVIVHCVKAFAEVIKICEPYINKIPIIIHGFNKSQKMAEQLIEKGFYISINHLLITKKEFELTCIPLNKLFLETDNNPIINIDSIYRMVANKLKIDEVELKEQIYTNFNCIIHGNKR